MENILAYALYIDYSSKYGAFAYLNEDNQQVLNQYINNGSEIPQGEIYTLIWIQLQDFTSVEIGNWYRIELTNNRYNNWVDFNFNEITDKIVPSKPNSVIVSSKIKLTTKEKYLNEKILNKIESRDENRKYLLLSRSPNFSEYSTMNDIFRRILDCFYKRDDIPIILNGLNDELNSDFQCKYNYSTYKEYLINLLSDRNNYNDYNDYNYHLMEEWINILQNHKHQFGQRSIMFLLNYSNNQIVRDKSDSKIRKLLRNNNNIDLSLFSIFSVHNKPNGIKFLLNQFDNLIQDNIINLKNELFEFIKDGNNENNEFLFRNLIPGGNSSSFERENFLETALREFKEETGYNLNLQGYQTQENHIIESNEIEYPITYEFNEYMNTYNYYPFNTNDNSIKYYDITFNVSTTDPPLINLMNDIIEFENNFKNNLQDYNDIDYNNLYPNQIIGDKGEIAFWSVNDVNEKQESRETKPKKF